MKEVFYDIGIKHKVDLGTIKRKFKEYSKEMYFLIYKTKIDEVPLYINSTTFCVPQIAKWRLSLGR